MRSVQSHSIIGQAVRLRSMDRNDSAERTPLNLCTVCGNDFGGERAFSMHKVGTHDYLYDQEHPDGRRCLSESEMLERDMYLNRQGRWSQPSNGLQERLGLG